MSDWRFNITRTALNVDWGLYIGIRRGARFDQVDRFAFKTLEEGDAYEYPTLGAQEAEDFLRAALNCAWDAGLRPDGYLDVRESMKATDAHLHEMRAIAFHKLGADKP